MKDVRIRFDGGGNTGFVLNEMVQDKRLFEQKYLINVATSKNTDAIFEDRGTNLLAAAIGGAIIDTSEATHAGAFAALDTLYFCTYEETPSVYESDIYVSDFILTPTYYDNIARSLSFTANFIFKDGTTTDSSFSIDFSE